MAKDVPAGTVITRELLGSREQPVEKRGAEAWARRTTDTDPWMARAAPNDR